MTHAVKHIHFVETVTKADAAACCLQRGVA